MLKFKKYRRKKDSYRIKLIELKIYKRRRILKLKNVKKRRIKLKRIFANNQVPHFYTKRLKQLYSSFIYNFYNQGFIKKEYIHKEIIVPKIFTMKNNFNDSILFFKELLSTYLLGEKASITINFSKCTKVCISNVTLFDIIMKEITIMQRRFNSYSTIKVNRETFIIPPEDEKVKKFLHSFGYYEFKALCNGEKGSYLPLGLQKGKAKTYYENRKSKVCMKIVNFVSNSFQGSDCNLTYKGRNAVENLVSEVLSNAEDHSLRNSYWYVNGISFKEIQHKIEIVELNLSIINIGQSMYEGFEETKIINEENYKKVENAYNRIKQRFTEKNTLEKESLFTLFMLQEGISRLKYEKESRGNGTMNFIGSFIILGAFGENNIIFAPELNIISGHTVLTCDNKYKPFEENGLKKLSLNKEKSLLLLPDKDYIHYNKEYFPGTFLECKIYLNKDFFHNILNNN